MARSLLSNIKEDVASDTGSTLFSFIKGEQLEYPVTLQFLSFILTSYTFEAVVVEGLNVAGQAAAPTTIKPGGVQTAITVRVPTYKGTWSSGGLYDAEDVVKYNGLYYKLGNAMSYTNSTLPNMDTLWILTTANTVYLQFFSTLGSTWSVQPTVDSSSYGFFELRVTEPANPVLQRTWKPVRGIIELLFSPTDIVP